MLEELIPMTRTDIVSLGVELFKLKFESLSSRLVSSRFIFPMNDLVSDFPNFIPVSPEKESDDFTSIVLMEISLEEKAT